MRAAVLVPVKALDGAKSRLADVLGAEQRRVLAWILLKRVLREGRRLAGVERRVVVTTDGPAMRLARRLGWEVLAEPGQESESASVDRASAHLERQGVEAVLRVPLDLPLVRHEELAAVLRLARAGVAAVLVPSRSGEGTNALLRRPPTLFGSRFGPGSLQRHAAAAQAACASHAVLPLPGVALDIDDGDDLAALLRTDPDGVPARYLRRVRAAGIPTGTARGD